MARADLPVGHVLARGRSGQEARHRHPDRLRSTSPGSATHRLPSSDELIIEDAWSRRMREGLRGHHRPAQLQPHQDRARGHPRPSRTWSCSWWSAPPPCSIATAARGRSSAGTASPSHGRVSMVLEGENPTSMAKTTGLGLLELSTVFANLEPGRGGDRRRPLRDPGDRRGRGVHEHPAGPRPGRRGQRFDRREGPPRDHQARRPPLRGDPSWPPSGCVKMGEDPTIGARDQLPVDRPRRRGRRRPCPRLRPLRAVRGRRGPRRPRRRLPRGAAAPGHHRVRGVANARRRNAPRRARLDGCPRCGSGPTSTPAPTGPRTPSEASGRRDGSRTSTSSRTSPPRTSCAARQRHRASSATPARCRDVGSNWVQPGHEHRSSPAKSGGRARKARWSTAITIAVVGTVCRSTSRSSWLLRRPDHLYGVELRASTKSGGVHRRDAVDRCHAARVPEPLRRRRISPTVPSPS